MAFMHLVELRSVKSSHVNEMGLTATATESALSVVIDCLAMCGD